MIEGICCTFITKLFSIDIIPDFQYSKRTSMKGIEEIGCQNIHLNFRLHKKEKLIKRLYIFAHAKEKFSTILFAETSNLIKKE